MYFWPVGCSLKRCSSPLNWFYMYYLSTIFRIFRFSNALVNPLHSLKWRHKNGSLRSSWCILYPDIVNSKKMNFTLISRMSICCYFVVQSQSELFTSPSLSQTITYSTSHFWMFIEIHCRSEEIFLESHINANPRL